MSLFLDNSWETIGAGIHLLRCPLYFSAQQSIDENRLAAIGFFSSFHAEYISLCADSILYISYKFFL